MRLYSAYKNGITPSGVWRDETSHYQAAMSRFAALEAEAEGWYAEQRERGKNE